MKNKITEFIGESDWDKHIDETEHYLSIFCLTIAAIGTLYFGGLCLAYLLGV